MPSATSLVAANLAIDPNWMQGVQTLDYVNGSLFYYGSDSVHGIELWRSNGTPAGSEMVADIKPGLNSGIWGSTLFRTEEANGTLFFNADDGVHGPELWITKGTPETTRLLRDINSGPAGSIHHDFHEHQGRVYFGAADGAGTVYGPYGPIQYTYDLWTSDGTEAGTYKVKDLPGEGVPSSFVSVGNTLYFTAVTDVGWELWKSDSTAEGTNLVKDINPGTGDGMGWWWHRRMVALGETLLFSANDGIHGQELWRSDGTEAGTYLVKDISTSQSLPAGFTIYQGRAYFSAHDSVVDGLIDNSRLWATDGTEAGTFMVSEGLREPHGLSVFNNALYFNAYDSEQGWAHALWKTDGTTAGTVPVDLGLGAGVYGTGGVTAVNGGWFYFTTSTGPYTAQLWQSDGTPEGTALIDTDAGYGSGIANLFVANGTLFFVKRSHGSYGAWTGDLWKVNSGEIHGTVFDDRNANGVQDANENGLSGRIVYLDANNNGKRDLGETSTVTGADGKYHFTQLEFGNYVVREVLPSGWALTTPRKSYRAVTLTLAGNTADTSDFGNRSLISVFHGDDLTF